MDPVSRKTAPDLRPTEEVRAEATFDLLVKVRDGDERALDRLIERYVPELRRWASGRLPQWSRHAMDTDDLVQETLIQAFRRIRTFEYRGEGALLAYLRQALLNRIRSRIRYAKRRPSAEELDEQAHSGGVSPLEAAIGAEALEAYEMGLARLKPGEREAIIARLELGLTYAELASALGKPTPDAARMAVARALVRLSEELEHGRTGGSPAGTGDGGL
jgi:RNA polymerase sigma-70 factor (ECF subfamily)